MKSQSLRKVLEGTYRSSIFNEIKKQPEQYFEETLVIYLEGGSKGEWRAGNILYQFLKKNDNRVSPHLDLLIEKLQSNDKSVIRETLRILFKFSFTDEQEGRLFNYCTNIWLNIDIPPGARFYALKHLSLIAKKYPELKHEVLLLLDENYIEPLSPGVKQSVKKIIRELRA